MGRISAKIGATTVLPFNDNIVSQSSICQNIKPKVGIRPF